MKTVTLADLLVAFLLTFLIGGYIGVHWAIFDWGRSWIREEVDRLVKYDRVLGLLEANSIDQAQQLQTAYLRQTVEKSASVPNLPEKAQRIVERRTPLLTH